MIENRFLSSQKTKDDMNIEVTLRPKIMSEYIGQIKVKEQLDIFISAAKMRSESLDHVLLYGPPGLGKTTLANIIANELNVQIRTTSGPAIERTGDLAAILTNLGDGDVLFIDEIHRMNNSVAEVLYPAMEDCKLNIIIGKGPSARAIRLDLPTFTLVGATTRAGMLTSPLLDRFGVVCRLEIYTPDELSQIIKRSSDILKTVIDEKGALEIAKRSRGTPRIANRLLKRVRDYSMIKADGKINIDVAQKGLEMLEVDELGLDNVDRRVLLAIMNKFNGGPVGLDTLAASTGEEATTIEDVYEPYLLQLGFINRTPRGRIAMPNAYKHFGIAYNDKNSRQESFLK